jgi:hypothetical protein
MEVPICKRFKYIVYKKENNGKMMMIIEWLWVAIYTLGYVISWPQEAHKNKFSTNNFYIQENNIDKKKSSI